MDTAKEETEMKGSAIAAYVTLIATCLLIYTAGGLENYPPWTASDEIAAGLEARLLVKLDEPLNWLVPWDVASGYEHITVVALRFSQEIFGSNLGGGRMVHVIFGTLTVVGLFGFGRRLIGLFPAWYAAMFLALCHVHIHLSRGFICTGIQSAALMVSMLWLLVGLLEPASRRSWIPRTLLAGLILGWSVQTYKLAYGFPILTALTLFAWRRDLPANWIRVVIVLVAGAIPTMVPWAVWIYQQYPNSLHHVASLAIDPSSTAPTVSFWGSPMAKQLAAMFTMWWVGRDPILNYFATIPVLDPLTGAAFALGLVRAVWQWRSRVSTLAAIWLPALMLGAVGLVNNGAGYYRLSVPLVWVCLLSGWGASGLALRLLPARLAHGLLVAALGWVAYYNLNYTFVRYPSEVAGRHQEAPLQLTTRVCAGEGSEADHTLLADDREDTLRRLLRLQCPTIYDSLPIPK